MKSTRRVFLKSSGLALVSVGLAPGWGPSFLRDAVFAAAPNAKARNGRRTLICIFQRGAVDGLSMVVPHGDPFYYKHRTTGNGGIAIARTGADGVLDLDGHFGLHPALAALKPIYKSGHMAAIHACGSPSNSRSHFDAQNYMECGTPDRVTSDGWMARMLAHCPEDTARHKAGNGKNAETDTFRSVSLTSQVPLSLHGAETLAVTDLRNFNVGAGNFAGRTRGRKSTANIDAGMTATAAGGFEAIYDNAVGDVLHGTGQDSFEAMKMLKSLTAKPYTPAAGANYPRTNFGQSLQQIAQLIKADVGMEVAFAETGAWDTHLGQGGAQGRLANSLRELGGGIAALYADLGDRMDEVFILTMSEFGRTVRQNGTGGTDHGHATCFLALGGQVSGGKVLGDWPGLSPEQLNENRDLVVTTDFRDVFGEVAMRHLGVSDVEAVFPGRAKAEMKFRNILRV